MTVIAILQEKKSPILISLVLPGSCCHCGNTVLFVVDWMLRLVFSLRTGSDIVLLPTKVGYPSGVEKWDIAVLTTKHSGGQTQ